VEFDDRSERLKQLVQIGKTRGYILYDEIDEFLLPTLEGDTYLDIVLTELASLSRMASKFLKRPGPDTKSLPRKSFRSSSKRSTILRR